MTRDWHATYLDDRVTMAAAHRHVAATGEDGWAAAVTLAGRIEPGLGNWDAIGAAAVIAPRQANAKADVDEQRWREQFSHASSALPPVRDWTPVHPAAVPRPPGATYAEYARRYDQPTADTEATQRQLADAFEVPHGMVGLPPQAANLEAFSQDRGHIEHLPGRFYRPGEQRPAQVYHVITDEMHDSVRSYQQNRNITMQQYMQQWPRAATFVFADEAAEMSETDSTYQQQMRSQLIEVLRLARRQTRVQDWPADVLACEAMTEARGRRLIIEDPPRRTPNRRIRLTALGQLAMNKIHGKRQP